MSSERVEVRQQPDGLWRWSYVEARTGDEPTFHLDGNLRYSDLDAALSAATSAYPALRVVILPYRTTLSVARCLVLLGLLVVVAIRSIARGRSRRRAGPLMQ